MRKLFIKVLSVFVVLIGLTQVAFSNQGNSNLTIEPYVFENSKKEKVNAEFGRLKVLENRTKKNGKMIELAFVRFKSTSKNPGSPIVYLAGGPGGSGIQSAKYSRFKLFMAMREFGDVIALEQRGAGKSKPNLRCSNSAKLPMDKPLTREAVIKAAKEELKECAKGFEQKGVDISAYNTNESADDINDLRKALGAKKVSLWGISYGTHLALTMIRRHEKHIDKAILAGVEGVDDTLKLPSYTQNIVKELNKRIKADSKLSGEVPNLEQLIKSVHTKLEKQPVTVEITNPRTKKKSNITLGKYDIQYLLSAYSGSNEAQALFPKLYYDMSKGNYSFLAQQMARARSGGSGSSVMSYAMDCASGISKQRSERVKKEKKKSLFSNAINDPFPEVCEVIKYKKLGEDFRKPVISNVPTLFISGTLDGRTPASNAEFAQKGFKNSSHLIIDGAGHSDPLFLSTPKIAETMVNFIKGEKLPKTINVEMEKPFIFVPIKTDNKVGIAKQKAEEMLKAIGGRKNWANLKSLYIKAIHKEERYEKPYQNEIWRNLEPATVKFIQQDDDFYTEAYFNQDEGWIVRKNGETNKMSAKQLAGLVHWDKFLVYRVFHDIAKNLSSLTYKIDEKGRLVVFKNSKKYSAFELDEKNRPYKFYMPKLEGKGESLTIFSKWKQTNGFIHPIVGEPQGNKAVFTTKEWKPSTTLLTIKFPKKIK